MPNNQKRPTIGITTSDRKSLLAWWCDKLAVWRAGGSPVRLSPSRPLGQRALDGLVVGGGDDIGAEIYKGKVALDAKIDPARDELELKLLKMASAEDLPVLGVCRGAQMINVNRGGTLHPNIQKSFKMKKNRRTVLPLKRITIKAESLLAGLLGKTGVRVNSLHNQAVNRLGKGLKISARDNYGIIQAIEDPDHPFLVGVQWHPEFLIFDHKQQRLFKALVKAAQKGES